MNEKLTTEKILEWVRERTYNSGRAYFYVSEFKQFLDAHPTEDEKDFCPECGEDLEYPKTQLGTYICWNCSKVDRLQQEDK